MIRLSLPEARGLRSLAGPRALLDEAIPHVYSRMGPWGMAPPILLGLSPQHPHRPDPNPESERRFRRCTPICRTTAPTCLTQNVAEPNGTQLAEPKRRWHPGFLSIASFDASSCGAAEPRH